MAKKQNADKDQLQLLKDAQSISKQMGVSEENIAQLQQSILDGRVKSYNMLLKELKTLQEIVAIEKEATRQRSEQEKIAAEQLKTETKRKQIVKDTADVEQDLAKTYNKLRQSKYDIAGMSDDEYDLTKDIVAKKREELAVLKESGLADQAKINDLETVLSKLDGVINEAGKLRDAFGAETFQAMNEGFETLQTNINKATSFLPKGLSRALGIDTFGKDLRNAALGVDAISPKLIMGGIVAGLAAAYALLDNINKQAKEFATQTGLTVAASQRLVEQSYSAQMSFGNQLSSQKDILAVQQEIISTLGPISELSNEVAVRVSETGKAFGYGAQEAAKVQAQMMQIGGFSETAAIEAQEFTAQLALAEGVAPGAVMKDIAKSAAVAAKYFTGNPKALGKAAVEAAKLGTSLDQMAKTSAALLNIEQSLEDQYVASAMLGRQINFDTARRLSAEGDIVGATQEVLKELGGIEEFENASIFAKERMAAAAGMTVEELSKSLAIEERRGELSDDQLAAMSGLNLSAAEITNMNAGDLKTKLANKQATEELAASMEKIKSAMVKFILPVAKALLPIFEMLATIISAIVWPFEQIGIYMDKFAAQSTFVKGIFTAIEYIMTALGAALVGSIIPGLIRMGVVAAKGVFQLLAGAIANIWKGAGGLGPVGWAAAGALTLGVGAAVYKFMNMDDGKMGPLGPTGHSRVMSGPEGSIAFNDKDTIVAGTDLNGGGGGSTSVISKASIDALVSAIQNLKIIIDESAVNAINKQGRVAASYNG
jgi:hypothetical protein